MSDTVVIPLISGHQSGRSWLLGCLKIRRRNPFNIRASVRTSIRPTTTTHCRNPFNIRASVRTQMVDDFIAGHVVIPLISGHQSGHHLTGKPTALMKS